MIKKEKEKKVKADLTGVDLSKVTFPLRLTYCFQETGLSQNEVGLRCGWQNAAPRVWNYVNGIREPYLADIVKLAKVFQTTPEWLAYGVGAPPFSKGLPPGHIYILEWEEVLRWPIIKPTENIKSIPLAGSDSYDCYGLIIESDAMIGDKDKKNFLIGEKIIINPHLLPKTRDYVIAHEKGASLPIFRQYIQDGPRLSLRALNSEYPPLIITDDIKILGVAIASLLL